MKIKHDQQEAAFKPINLTLTIETEDELKALWSYLVLPRDEVNRYAIDNRDVWSTTYEALYGLWDIIDDICEQRGLKK